MSHRFLRFYITLTVFVTLIIPDKRASAVIDQVSRIVTTARHWKPLRTRMVIRMRTAPCSAAKYW